MRFYLWIKEFEKVNLPIGDLAKDILADPYFPRLANSQKTIKNYLIVERDACFDAVKTFENAWKAYEMKL